jgi:hypothetical protein
MPTAFDGHHPSRNIRRNHPRRNRTSAAAGSLIKGLDTRFTTGMVSAFSFPNYIMNPLIRLILRSPLRFLLDGNLIAISYTGRRSGRRFSLVTMYAESGTELLVVVAQPEKKKWWRNFHEKAPADVLFKGRRFACVARVPEGDPASTISRLEAYCSRHPSLARSYKLRREKDGKFNSEDIARAAKDVVMVVFERPPSLVDLA